MSRILSLLDFAEVTRSGPCVADDVITISVGDDLDRAVPSIADDIVGLSVADDAADAG